MLLLLIVLFWQRCLAEYLPNLEEYLGKQVS